MGASRVRITNTALVAANKVRCITGVTGSGNDKHSTRWPIPIRVLIKLGAEFTPGTLRRAPFLQQVLLSAASVTAALNVTFDGHRLGEWPLRSASGVPVQFLAISGVNVGF